MPSSFAFFALALLLTFSDGDAATAAKPATTFSNMSQGIDANSTAIISLARRPLILEPSPRGKHVIVL